MKRLFAISMFFASSAFATTPPNVPAGVPGVVGSPIPSAQIPTAVAPVFTTLNELNQMGLSGTVYHAFKRALLEHGGAAKPVDVSGPAVAQPNAVGSVIYTADASNDANQDVEPAISTIRYLGTDWIVTVATKYITDPIYGPGTVRSFYSRSTGAYPPSYSAPQQLLPPMGYRHVSDPYIAENPYTSSGMSPHTLYCVGILHNNFLNQANAVAIWRSSDGGANWQGPATIIAPDNTHFYDKPSITVSYAGNTLGWVYVTWVDVNINNRSASTVKIARSCDGAATFPTATRVDVSAAGYVSDPQVMVDNTNSRAYVVYTNHEQALRLIRMATVLDGVNCSVDVPSLFATENATGTRNFMAFTDGFPLSIYLNRNVQAVTTPVARFNFVARRIGVVWHERESAGAPRTDCYITTRSMSTGLWSPPRLLTDNSSNDQFMPTLDSDTNGQWLTSFYNRAPDVSNTRYESFCRPFPAAGGAPTQAEQFISGASYDPMSQPTDPGFVGDYQDIWQWTFADGTSRWNAAWIATSPSDNMGSVIYDF